MKQLFYFQTEKVAGTQRYVIRLIACNILCETSRSYVVHKHADYENEIKHIDELSKREIATKTIRVNKKTLFGKFKKYPEDNTHSRRYFRSKESAIEFIKDSPGISIYNP